MTYVKYFLKVPLIMGGNSFPLRDLIILLFYGIIVYELCRQRKRQGEDYDPYFIRKWV